MMISVLVDIVNSFPISRHQTKARTGTLRCEQLGVPIPHEKLGGLK